jgi:hypothetical protein
MLLEHGEPLLAKVEPDVYLLAWIAGFLHSCR